MNFDPVAFGKGVGEFVRKAVGEAVAGLTSRMEALEAAHAELKSFPIPKDGTGVTVDEVLPVLTKQVQAHMDALPVPQDGKSVTVEEVVTALLPKLDELQARWALDFERRAQGVLERAVDRLPKAAELVPVPPAQGVTLAEVEPLLKALLEPLQAQWALDFERRAQDTLQRSLDRLPPPKDGKDGRDGLNGRDAFELEDITLALADDGRTLTLGFVRGEVVLERSVKLEGMPMDRGFWREGLALEKGDGVTFGGSYWIAQKDTTTKPDTTNPDFRLTVKKGRDGKDGKDGERGLPGLNARNVA